MLKRFFFLCGFGLLSLVLSAQPYWNQHLRILPLRAPVCEDPEFLDLNGDGRQDAVRGHIAGGVPILWLDDDGNMQKGDLEDRFMRDGDTAALVRLNKAYYSGEWKAMLPGPVNK